MAPGWARVLWFIFVGWWVGLIWVGIGIFLMATIILLPFGGYMLSKTWEIMTLEPRRGTDTGDQVVNTQISSTDISNSTHTESPEIANSVPPSPSNYQYRDIQTIKPGHFYWFEFGIGRAHILDYSIEALDGTGVNVIVTDKNYVEDFNQTPNIRWKEESSVLNVREMVNKSRLEPRDYAFIIDNTGRLGNQDGRDPARVEFKYSLSVI